MTYSRAGFRIAGVALAASAFAIAGCGGSAGDGSKATNGGTTADYPTGKKIPSGPVNLTMWWWGEQEAKGAKAWISDSVTAYEKKHPNVKIKTVLQTTDGLVPTFQTAAAAKKGPDIEYMWGGINNLQNAWKNYIRPVGDYIPADEQRHYLNAKEDTFEGKLWSMPWYVQPSFPVLYRKDVLTKAGMKAPQTWPELLAACDKLRSAGVTPISGGLKDGFFAGWLYSIIGVQNVSAADVLDAVQGKQKFDDPKHSAWWSRLQDLRGHKCFNDDINSLQLYQGQERWSQGKAAMTITAGSDVRRFIKAVGDPTKVGVMAMPKWGDGPYAGKLGSTSQTLGITKTSRFPQVAADFLQFLHTPERLAAFYDTTGAIPADDRFDSSAIKSEQEKWLYEQTREFAPYLEDFIPAELDGKAVFTGAQSLLSGNEDAKAAAAATEKLAQRLRLTQPDDTSNFGKWAATYR